MPFRYTRFNRRDISFFPGHFRIGSFDLIIDISPQDPFFLQPISIAFDFHDGIYFLFCRIRLGLDIGPILFLCLLIQLCTNLLGLFTSDKTALSKTTNNINNNKRRKRKSSRNDYIEHSTQQQHNTTLRHKETCKLASPKFKLQKSTNNSHAYMIGKDKDAL